MPPHEGDHRQGHGLLHAHAASQRQPGRKQHAAHARGPDQKADDQRSAASNVIEVYVRYLRQKLEEQGEKRLIHTVRGQGYCLSDGPPPR